METGESGRLQRPDLRGARHGHSTADSLWSIRATRMQNRGTPRKNRLEVKSVTDGDGKDCAFAHRYDELLVEIPPTTSSNPRRIRVDTGDVFVDLNGGHWTTTSSSTICVVSFPDELGRLLVLLRVKPGSPGAP
jgi:hypothetical protein